jgi:hypothetical protein
MQKQHVFISYRHESPEHARAVRYLGELLRQANLPVALDQFYLDEHPGGPDLGWRKWCESCANDSACVLIAASEGWFAAYEKKGPPGVGLGAAIEADLFGQALYDEKGHNARIRLAFLHEIPMDKVPPRLRDWRQFQPFRGDGELNDLIRWAAGRLGKENVELPRIAWPDPVPFRPNLADRLDLCSAIEELIAGRSRKRILMYEGPSGLGKSALVKQVALYAQNLGVSVVYIDCKGGGLSLGGIVGQFDSNLDLKLPHFSRERQTHLLRAELRALRRPVLVIIDTYEHVIGNQTIADWVNRQLIAEVETALGLLVIIAGQSVPDYEETSWKDLVYHLHLSPITEIQHWKPWVEQHYPDFQKKGADLKTIMLMAQGNPAVVSSAVETISKL